VPPTSTVGSTVIQVPLEWGGVATRVRHPAENRNARPSSYAAPMRALCPWTMPLGVPVVPED
jgi:hypothetical protein